jgi:hypothetical protein
LPEQLDEPWYPQLRAGLQRLHNEQVGLFTTDLAQWLQPHLS